MNKIIAISTALLLTGSVYAGNDDQYSGHSESKKFATAVQPGVGDQYGSVVFGSDNPAGERTKVQRGSNEGYGSILLDLGHNIDW